MNPSVLVMLAWAAQLLLLYGRRANIHVTTIFGAILDIAFVVWLCIQHRWILAAFTFAVLPSLTSAILGLWTGTRNNHIQMPRLGTPISAPTAIGAVAVPVTSVSSPFAATISPLAIISSGIRKRWCKSIRSWITA